MRQNHIFATAAPALLACALRASLQLIEHDEWRRAHLQRLIARLRTGLTAGLQGSSWQLSESQTAIQPLLIGRNDEALAVMEGLRARDLWVPAIRPPTFPEGTARLRIALSAAHTETDIDQLIDALTNQASALR